MRKISLFAVLSWSAITCLAAGPIPPRLTGEQLVERYGKTGTELFTLRDQSYLDGYLAGAADAGEGQAWCNTGKVQRGEIDSYVVGEIRDVRPEHRRGNAAPLVTSALKRKFPCPVSRNAR
ncbi:Rap1a/Tai family immunity protein [Cupriavidus sp. 2KB_3]|uniref:Rap1a/Tai family immunity protein n=1 Tax=Cupriavidus TaxID=106589 RepID=UPI0011EBF286|nr:Rap1a/Tai family immunity protein [Cupriavidus campinensis]